MDRSLSSYSAANRRATHIIKVAAPERKSGGEAEAVLICDLGRVHRRYVHFSPADLSRHAQKKISPPVLRPTRNRHVLGLLWIVRAR